MAASPGSIKVIVPSIEYLFRILNSLLHTGGRSARRVEGLERMFNILNTQKRTGKNSAWMCKFLDTLGAFFHGFLGHSRRPVHLLEKMGLRNQAFRLIGLRIAFPILAGSSSTS
jgi:hypothetical protein